MKPKLLLVTRNYPYRSNGGEVMFVKPEIPHLSKHFNVTVAPIFCEGPLMDEVSDVTIDSSLSETVTENRRGVNKLFLITKALCSIALYREIYQYFTHGIFPNLKQLGVYILLLMSTKKWLKKKKKYQTYDLYYTYWANAVTSGIVDLCKDKPIITRVHGYDLYLERHGGYIPGYDYNFHRLSQIITISEHAVNYLKAYGISDKKIYLSRMGVSKEDKISNQGRRKNYILSCSSVIPLKRVEKIYMALKKVSRNNEQLTLHWTHLGGGEMLQSLKSGIEATCPPNLIVSFKGQLMHNEVISYYKRNPVDIFIHASESEGLPVSMQEALSFGVPIISTNVGGISEIVTPDVGILVNPDKPAEELAKAVQTYLGYDEEKVRSIRLAAKKRQEELFYDDKNHDRFARKLLELENFCNN